MPRRNTSSKGKRQNSELKSVDSALEACQSDFASDRKAGVRKLCEFSAQYETQHEVAAKAIPSFLRLLEESYDSKSKIPVYCVRSLALLAQHSSNIKELSKYDISTIVLKQLESKRRNILCSSIAVLSSMANDEITCHRLFVQTQDKMATLLIHKSVFVQINALALLWACLAYQGACLAILDDPVLLPLLFEIRENALDSGVRDNVRNVFLRLGIRDCDLSFTANPHALMLRQMGFETRQIAQAVYFTRNDRKEGEAWQFSPMLDYLLAKAKSTPSSPSIEAKSGDHQKVGSLSSHLTERNVEQNDSKTSPILQALKHKNYGSAWDTKAELPSTSSSSSPSSSSSKDLNQDWLASVFSEESQPLLAPDPVNPAHLIQDHLSGECRSSNDEHQSKTDFAVAHLLEMGFSAEQAVMALSQQGESGSDIEVATLWLLNNANILPSVQIDNAKQENSTLEENQSDRSNASTRKSNCQASSSLTPAAAPDTEQSWVDSSDSEAPVIDASDDNRDHGHSVSIEQSDTKASILHKPNPWAREEDVDGLQPGSTDHNIQNVTEYVEKLNLAHAAANQVAESSRLGISSRKDKNSSNDDQIMSHLRQERLSRIQKRRQYEDNVAVNLLQDDTEKSDDMEDTISNPSLVELSPLLTSPVHTTHERGVEIVCKRLEEWNFGDYVDVFRTEEIDIEALGLLTDSHLSNMGLKTIGKRVILLQRIRVFLESLKGGNSDSTDNNNDLSPNSRQDSAAATAVADTKTTKRETHFSFLEVAPLLQPGQAPGSTNMLNFEEERLQFCRSLYDSGRQFRVKFDFASVDTLLQTITQRTRCLHISGHGHPQTLVLEDGIGGLTRVPVAKLEAVLKHAGGSALKFVFISSCYSSMAAQAFVQAGIPHVISVNADTKVRDDSAILFARYVYLSLCEGKTVKEAFLMGRAGVIANSHTRAPACCCAHLHKNGCTPCEICGVPRCCVLHVRPCHEKTHTPCCVPSIPHDESLKFQLLPENGNHEVPLFFFSHNTVENSVDGKQGIQLDEDIQLINHHLAVRTQPYIDCSLPKPAHNIPSLPGQFCGRAKHAFELATVVRLRRLCCISGPPGQGKSVLARAVGHFLRDRRIFEDGCFVLSLRGCSKVHEIESTLVRALRLDVSIDHEQDQQTQAEVAKLMPHVSFVYPDSPSKTPPKTPPSGMEPLSLSASETQTIFPASSPLSASSPSSSSSSSLFSTSTPRNKVAKNRLAYKNAVRDYLHNKTMLLIWDDCDSFLMTPSSSERFREYLQDFLDQHPKVTVLLTSQKPVTGVAGNTNRVYSLPPLHDLDQVSLFYVRFPRELKQYDDCKTYDELEKHPIFGFTKGNPRLVEWCADLLAHISLDAMTQYLATNRRQWPEIPQLVRRKLINVQELSRTLDDFKIHQTIVTATKSTTPIHANSNAHGQLPSPVPGSIANNDNKYDNNHNDDNSSSSSSSPTSSSPIPTSKDLLDLITMLDRDSSPSNAAATTFFCYHCGNEWEDSNETRFSFTECAHVVCRHCLMQHVQKQIGSQQLTCCVCPASKSIQASHPCTSLVGEAMKAILLTQQELKRHAIWENNHPRK